MRGEHGPSVVLPKEPDDMCTFSEFGVTQLHGEAMLRAVFENFRHQGCVRLVKPKERNVWLHHCFIFREYLIGDIHEDVDHIFHITGKTSFA